MAEKQQMSDEDLAAMIVAKDSYVESLDGRRPRETKDIFYGGFQLGVAYARGQWKPPEVADEDDSADEDEDDRADS